MPRFCEPWRVVGVSSRFWARWAIEQGIAVEALMGIDEKADNKAEELKGKGKEVIGDATDDKDLQAKGRAEEAKGSLKQAGEKVKDAFKS
jgi:uncharacterized protein YjbJ (UPF0337 family)